MIATILRTDFRRLHLINIVSAFAVATGALLAMPGAASAQVSANVRNACMGDYFEYCAGMEVGSQELRRCFNRNGAKLSAGCVTALVGAGEVSQSEVNRRGGVRGATRSAQKPAKKKAVTTASRSSVCVSGPSRPGARSATLCRGTVAT
jgi:hypothetical protein